MEANVSLIQEYLKRKRSRHHKIASIICFLKNLDWIINKIRPAFISESIVDVEVLKGLLHELSINGKPKYDCSSICILSLDENHFIVNVKACISHLELIVKYLNEQPTYLSKLSPIFVDISYTNSKPKIANNGDMMLIEKSCQHIRKKLMTELDTKVCSVTFNENTNLCTIFGCILGYPVVYFFKESHRNCLAMTSLTVIKIILSQNNNQVVSFSYPNTLEKELQGNVRNWYENIVKYDTSVEVQKSIIQMPFVVL